MAIKILIKPVGSALEREDGAKIILKDDNCVWAGYNTIWFTQTGWDEYTSKRKAKKLTGMP